MSEKIIGHGKMSNSDIRIHLVAIVFLAMWLCHALYGQWIMTPIFIGSVLLIYFSLVPRAMLPFANGMMFLVSKIGRINNFLVLGIVFYLLMTPIGFFMKMLSANRVELNILKNQKSYWKLRESKGNDIDFKSMS